ncbi:MAG TPA: hypothetical protein VFZ25_06560, partial [Chloroflexota bacterium]|nr:hypothetical protein [Chloroflexota bacterium]
MHGPRAWTVLLIGGASSLGKTTVGRDIGRKLGVPVLQADDFRMAMQRITTESVQPALHYFLDGRVGKVKDGIWQRAPEELCRGLRGVGSVVSRSLEVVISHHLAVVSSGPIIVEGDGILPSLAAQDRIDGAPALGRVRSVFLYEPDERQLRATMLRRFRPGDVAVTDEDRNFAGMHWLYGEWLRQEAELLSLPTIPSRPYDTLVERILSV